MAQRFTEVSVCTHGESYLNLDVTDDSKVAADSQPLDCAGGQSFTGDVNFMATWRICCNVAEVVIDGMNNSVHKTNIRITCHYAPLAGNICIASNEAELTLMLASAYSVHVITLATSAARIGVGMRIRSSKTYPVDSESPIKHCSASATEDFGIVFSLVNENGQLLVATVQNGVYEQTELKQTSIISTIWNRVRRSVISGPTDGSNVVASVISEEHPSIYCLTKDFQLQQWAIGSWECVSTYNLTAYVSPTHYIHGQMLRFFSHQPNSLLGIHFTDGPQKSKVMLLCVSAESGQLGKCNLIADCGENTPLSYQVAGDEFFVLWVNNNNRHELVHVSMYSGDTNFTQSHIKKSTLQPVPIENYDDPRQVFTEQIFRTNQLCVPALLKAIHMLDPVAATGLITEQMEYSIDELKKMTWHAISNEVRDSVSTDEVTNMEYRDLQIEVWNKFYADLTQHYEELMQPRGIADGGPHLPMAFIRKSCVSFVRPCERFERQLLFPTEPCAGNQDVGALMKSLNLLYNYVEGFDEHIYMYITNGDPVGEGIAQVIQAITTRPDHAVLKAKFSDQTQNVHMLRDSVSVLLHFLDITNQLPTGDGILQADTSVENNSFHSMSATGLDIVCFSVADMVNSRYRLCCNLVLYLEYLAQLSEEINRSEDLRMAMEDISDTCHALLRSYATLVWLCNLSASTTNKQDFGEEVVEALKCANGDYMESMLLPADGKHGSLLACFLANMGGNKVKALHAASTDQSTFYGSLNMLVMATCQAIWPETTDMILPQFLLASNELIHLQTYCRLLEGHCKSSAPFRLFLLGQTYLIQGAPEKAHDCFIMALDGMLDSTEPDDMDTGDGRELQLQFCYKTMNVLEKLSFSEQVILMAHEALKFSDNEQPTLYSKLFKHNLDLQRYDEAYQAILNNQDRDGKMNCLSQFVSAMCDAGQLKQLISYPYKDMNSQEDLRHAVLTLLLRKARSVDLTTKNYYDLLYAFHVTSNDMLSAANVMHECAERIKCELTGVSALRKRAKCYLACIHALHCVPARSAWIAPASVGQPKYLSGGTKSPKRTERGRSKMKSSVPIKVYTLADIEKEYMLDNMALRLASNGCKQITGSAYVDAAEIATYLCAAGMYDEAIQVCIVYKLSLNPVFESLTFRCLRMSKEKEADCLNEESEVAKRWLTYSQLPAETVYSSPCDQAWRILRHFLEKHENVSTKYHRAVASKLLTNSTALPEWFLSSYKRKNVAELLRVYLQHDMVKEAVDLSADYLGSMSGHTYESFGLEGPLSATMSPAAVAVPFASIDLLMNVLAEHCQDPYYDRLYTKLKDSVHCYTTELEMKSRDVERRLLGYLMNYLPLDTAQYVLPELGTTVFIV